MQITQIRNATIIVKYNNIKFLIDPWLVPKESMPGFDSAVNSQVRQPRVDLPLSIEKIVDVDAVIVTHLHPDHWDEVAENSIDKHKKIFVQAQFDQNYLFSKGFIDVEIINEQGTQFNGVTLFKTLTQHGKREIVKAVCEAIGLPYEAMGVVFQAKNEKTLYVAGDTIFCDEVQDALNKFIPDVIVVNACAATVLNGERLIMNLADLDNVIKYSKVANIIASHMDAVSHLTLTRADIRAFKQEHGYTNLLIPEDGETLEF